MYGLFTEQQSFFNVAVQAEPASTAHKARSKIIGLNSTLFHLFHFAQQMGFIYCYIKE